MSAIEDILALAAREKAAARAISDSADSEVVWSSPPANGHAVIPAGIEDSSYGLAALEDECAKVAAAPEGTRNATLNTAAFKLGQLIAAGKLSEPTALFNLTSAARMTGLEMAEISLVLRGDESGGLAAGAARPRAAPFVASAPVLTVASVDDYVEPVEHTSWWLRDLGAVIEGSEREPGPEHLYRDDGQALFYRGKVNGLIGESESGKTWVALLAVAQALRAAETVLYLDFEDSAAGIVGRLRDLGVSEAELLAGLAYIDPAESLHFAAQADLDAVLALHRPGLTILDGFNAAMTLLGLDLLSNKDATVFAQRLLKPLTATGSAVVYVDHLPKNHNDVIAKGGIGAQAKRAMTTGCALTVEVLAEFGRGMTGRLRLSVDKDRGGYVRAASTGAKGAGVAVLISHPDGTVEVSIEGPDLRPAEDREPWRPTHLMEAVSRYLETVAGAVSGKAIEEGVRGRREHLRLAVAALVEEGFVGRESGPRGAVLHRCEKAYREVDLAPILTSPHLAPTSPGANSNDLAPPPPSLRGGRGQRGEVDSMTSPSKNGASWTTDDDSDEPEPWWQK